MLVPAGITLRINILPSFLSSFLPSFVLSFFLCPFVCSFLHFLAVFLTSNPCFYFYFAFVLFPVSVLFISFCHFQSYFSHFISLLVVLLISLSLPLLLSFGTSFLICIYFSHCLFAPFAASFTFLSHDFTPFFCL